MTAANDRLPSPEDEWFTHDPNEPEPPHERVISEARAVQEALARLGRTASDEAVQRDLERVGVRVGLARIAEVRAEMHAAGQAVPPSEMVRTEGETVPPPGARPAAASGGPARVRTARPSDLVKTEGEPVPPPQP